MKTILLSLTCLASIMANAQTFEYLDINQVKARVNSGGDLHWDPTTANGSYECPIGSGKNYGGSASLWIGGLDAGGQLKLAGQTYHQGGVDYYPGPLSTLDATTNSVTVNLYNRVWKINKSDIDAFLTNVANGNVQNGTYTIPNSILNWPGNGDVTQNQDAILAPFVDVNTDGSYDPTAGDYPLIKGDQAIFTIFNDSYLPHQGSGGASIGIEIRLMAYAYGTSTLVASNPYLNYTTFYNYTIINRSTLPLYNAYIGLFNDNDIGNYADDFIGCSVSKAYAYTYNSPTVTANAPAIGIAQTRGPLNISNGIDDNGDGQIDEAWEQMSMTNFMYFNNSFPGVPIQTTDPSNATEYYQYIKSMWKDGTSLTCGGNGYGGSTASNFAYPASTFTNGPCGTTTWSEGDAGSDKKFVMSSGPFIFQPGAFEVVEYAYIASYDSITNNPLGNLDNAVQSLRLANSSAVTGIKENNNDNSFALSPNPTHDQLTIQINQATMSNVKIEVMDVFGKILLSHDYKDFTTTTTIDVSNLSSGFYFTKFSSDKKQITKKFIKE
jgi:hypothetical protein